MKSFLDGVTGFFSPTNLGALFVAFLVLVPLAYAGWTPESIAAQIPRPSEF